MGWNSWNTFGSEVDEIVVRETAAAMMDTGLLDAGYRFVNIDDFWQAEARKDGRLIWDSEKFLSGIPRLAADLHGMGFSFGLYSCAGTHTCGGRPGSYGHEAEDAKAFAEWGVDFLKYDNCYLPPGLDGRLLFRRMGMSLLGCGRPILFSACEWGRSEPWLWAASVGASMWRISGDIDDRWDSIVENGFRLLADLAPYAGPGRWNDPDMLVVGMHGVGNDEVVDGTGCTDAEYRSQFALWCLASSPLFIGADIRNLDKKSLDLLSNTGAIAINQDVLGIPGRRIGIHEHGGENAEVWSRPLADGSIAVGLFNMGNQAGRRVSVAWESLGLDVGTSLRVRDVLDDIDLGLHHHEFTGFVDGHDVMLLQLRHEKNMN
ncbi:MAG: glycoside hydrolase family 27 protein [Spirochaetaceae bacterium]|nr:glycoside hydrolase family 27 protein [Spirochaetaceae bacterium]